MLPSVESARSDVIAQLKERCDDYIVCMASGWLDSRARYAIKNLKIRLSRDRFNDKESETK